MLGRLYILLFLLLTSSGLFAQTYSYKNYSVKDGLPSSEVFCVIQDSKGYMWFGTDFGVSRFNGYEFQNFSTQNGLPDNTTFGIYEDHKGRIWFRSISGKLSYFFNDSIFRLPINDSIPKLLVGGLITSLAVDPSDTLFIGSSRGPGIMKYDLRSKPASVTFEKMDWGQYFYKINSSIVFGDKLQKELGAQVPSTVPIHLYNKKTRPIELKDVMLSRFKEPDETVFIRSAIELPFDQAAFDHGKFLVVLSSDSVLKSKKFNSAILKTVQGPNNEIWIVLRDGGAWRFKNNDISSDGEHFLGDISISNCTVDNEGGAWFTTLGKGVYYMPSSDIKNFDASTGLPFSKPQTIKSNNGVVWIGTYDGGLFNYKKNSFSDNLIPESLKIHSPINDILFVSNETMYASSTIGIVSFNISPFRLNLFQKKYPAYHCTLDSNKSIWFHMTNCLRNIDDLKSSKLLTSIEAPTRITGVARDKQGVFWVGCMSGLYKYDAKTGGKLTDVSAESPLLKYRIGSLVFDTKENLWMATKEGGLIVRTNAGSYINITKKHGLKSETCRCIHIDANNVVWLGTSSGISKIEVIDLGSQKFTIHNYDDKYGLLSNEVNTIHTVNDTVWVGTTNGISYFIKNEIKENTVAPPIYITKIKIHNKEIALNAEYNLAYEQNFLNIDFNGIALKTLGQTNYRYRMIGIDSNWQTTTYRSLQYTSLKPGDYIFEVLAQNNDGIWSKTPATVHFSIAPPFWETWWFRITVVLVLAGFVYWRIHLIKKRERYKTETNKQLTALELKSIKSQMNPHFLFNSLNALTELTEEKSDEAPKFVTSLSKFYRYSLQNREREFVELSEEIKHIEGYIYMLKVRFGNAFNVVWNIDHRYNDHLIPSHALQLLIENVTKHNVVSASKPMVVEIFTQSNDTLVIKNKLQRKTGHITSTKVGLSSIGQRYELLTNKKLNIIETIEIFSVELPLINPDDYEGTHDRG